MAGAAHKNLFAMERCIDSSSGSYTATIPKKIAEEAGIDRAIKLKWVYDGEGPVEVMPVVDE